MKSKKTIIIMLIIILLLVLATCGIIYIKFNPFVKKGNNNVSKDKNYYIKIECKDKEINVGESTNCKLKGYAAKEIKIFEGKLSSSDNVEITNIKKDSRWTFGSDDENIQLITNGLDKEFDIISFDIKGKNKGDANLTVGKLEDKLRFTLEELKDVSVDKATYIIKIK